MSSRPGSSQPTTDVEVAEATKPVFRAVGEELIYQGAVISVHRGEVEGPGGDRFTREIVRHPGAVSVVPYDDGDVFLVRQYRACLDADLWEIPAGRRDVRGEPPEVTAQRELEEEVGLQAGSIELLFNIHHSPGFCDEYGWVYLATDLTSVPQRLDGPEEEQMVVARVPLADAVAMSLDGRITDAKSIAGLLVAARKFGF